MFFSFGSCCGVSGRKRYHHVRDPQPFLERSPARVDIELQRPCQDTFKEKLPCCARKGRWLLSFLSCLTLFYPKLSCPLPSCAFFVCAVLSYPLLSCRIIISYPFSCCLPIFCFHILYPFPVKVDSKLCCAVRCWRLCYVLNCGLCVVHVFCCVMLCWNCPTVPPLAQHVTSPVVSCHGRIRLLSLWFLSGVVCLERCANDNMSRGGTCNGRSCKRTYNITVGIISHTWYHGNHLF